MAKKLFLLDGMALVYRAHFAFVSRPILTSRGVNTSALYGFTQTLLDILNNQQPTHLGVAFDTEAPTQRHIEFADYKATRQAMPEDLSAALPHVRRVVEAFNVPVLTRDGYEADDIIGTLVRRAERRAVGLRRAEPAPTGEAAPAGNLVLSILLSLAQFERETTSRTWAGRATCARRVRRKSQVGRRAQVACDKLSIWQVVTQSR